MSERPILVLHCRHDIADDWLAGHIEAAEKAYGASMEIRTQRGPSGDPSAFDGRDVVFWPWLGSKSAQRDLGAFAAIVARTAKRVRMIAPTEDCDRIGPAGLNGHDPVPWARKHCVEIEPSEAVDLDAAWFGEDGHVLADVQPEAEPERYVPVSEWVPPDVAMLEGSCEPPLNIFETLPVPALERDALPWAIADYVFDQSALIGTDPGILGLACLVTLAGCCDDAIQAQPKQYEYRWRESARIWGAVVAGPAEKKSPPIRRATAHLRQIDMKLAEEVANRLEMYARDLADHEKAKARAKGNFVGEAPARPKERCLIVDDATTESLGKVLRDNPRGLLMIRDELSGWFGSMDAYSGAQGKDAAFYLECYEGDPGKVSRITRDAGPIPNKSLCILGGIQPDPMRKIAHRLNEDGLLQRFIVVCPTRAAGLGEDRPPDREAESAWQSVMDAVLAMKGDKERPVLFSAEARAVLVEVSNAADAEAAKASTPSRMRVHLGKWQGLFVRLCLLYHVIEAAAANQQAADSEVPRGTAETVKRLMLDYLLPHLRAFYGNVLDQNATAEHARWIAGYILARDATFISIRDINRAYGAWKRLMEGDQKQVMRSLVDAAWLEPNGRGWKVNPMVHETFAENAEIEKARRRAVKEQISVAASIHRNMND